MEALSLYLPEEIIRCILRHTNRKVRDMLAQGEISSSYYTGLFDYDEFMACLAVILRAGCDRDNLTCLHDMWTPQDGKPFYRAVIGRNRFKFFLRAIRLDNYRTRETRKRSDRLAAISEVWHMFVDNLRRFYIPRETLTIDEQLLGYRGRIPGRTYMPSKPKKYGLKIFWLCEAGTGFALNALIYTGRGLNEPRHTNLGKDVVMKLCIPYFNTNRDIITDNFFTSHALAKELLINGLTILGTLRKQRLEVPNVLLEKKEVLSSTFLYDHANKVTLVSYTPARNRVVILLSSSHGEGIIARHDTLQRPQMILDYNQGKGGVDQMDENVAEFSCVRKTLRWPLLVFYNMLDVAINNSFIHIKRDGYAYSRKTFIRELSCHMAGTFAKRRHMNRNLSKSIQLAADLFGFLPIQQVSNPSTTLGRCYLCSKVSRSKCDKCYSFICPTHRCITKLCLCLDC
jgi:hypothetical protein